MSGSIFSSNLSEHRWTDQLSEHFIIYIDNLPSIFQVPKSILDTNPGAYTPQKIGIGPYHNFRSGPGEMDSRKLVAVKKFLSRKQYKNFKNLVVNEVKTLEPSIRSYYNQYLDIDCDTLAWVMAIDGIYLLHLLSTYSGEKPINFDDRNIAQDIIMMENQLPYIVLKEIKKALQSPDNKEDKVKDADEEEDGGEDEDQEEDEDGDGDWDADEDEDEDENEDEDEEEEEEEEDKVDDEVEVEKKGKVKNDMELFSEMLSFCKAHTPINLRDDPKFVSDTTSPHLLSYMHSLIVHNWSAAPVASQLRSLQVDFIDLLKRILNFLAGITGLPALMVLANLPLRELADLLKNDNNDTTNSSIEKITIPSVSELRLVLKIQFKVWPYSGIGIEYGKEYRTLYLPEIRLNTDSEVFLRNLVAYEVASGSSNVVCGFVDFMCGIIRRAKDVDLLKENEVIKSKLPSEEIAKIFYGISKSNRMPPDLEETTHELNETYNSSFRVKAWRFIKNHLVPPEACVKLFLAILLILLLTLQAFCQVYGCRAHWFGKKINSIFDS